MADACHQPQRPKPRGSLRAGPPDTQRNRPNPVPGDGRRHREIRGGGTRRLRIRGRRCVMTPLTRKVTRRSSETYRDRSKLRRIVVTLYPSGVIGLLLEKTRQEETLSLGVAYETAVRARVAYQRSRKTKRKGGRS